MSKYTAREYDEADATYTAMEEAEYSAEDLIEHLKGTDLEGWTDTLKGLLEEIKALKDEADEVLGEEEAEYRKEVEWQWYHR